ncbi:MAG: hypothetical protein M3N27_05700, partial [Thermoproteota archaeon]|nr:hypothetical protein [Thermoproteota archaeon]
MKLNILFRKPHTTMLKKSFRFLDHFRKLLKNATVYVQKMKYEMANTYVHVLGYSIYDVIYGSNSQSPR